MVSACTHLRYALQVYQRHSDQLVEQHGECEAVFTLRTTRALPHEQANLFLTKSLVLDQMCNIPDFRKAKFNILIDPGMTNALQCKTARKKNKLWQRHMLANQQMGIIYMVWK